MLSPKSSFIVPIDISSISLIDFWVVTSKYFIFSTTSSNNSILIGFSSSIGNISITNPLTENSAVL